MSVLQKKVIWKMLLNIHIVVLKDSIVNRWGIMRKVILIVFSSIAAVLLIGYALDTFITKSFSSYSNSIEWNQYFTSGNQYANKSDYQNAILQYEQSIRVLRKEISEDSTKSIFIFQVLLSKAGCLEQVGDAEKALEIYQEVITENEKIDLAHKKLSNSYTAMAVIKQGLIYLKNDKEAIAETKFIDSINYLQNSEIIDYSTKKDIKGIIDFYHKNNDQKRAKIFEGFLEHNGLDLNIH